MPRVFHADTAAFVGFSSKRWRFGHICQTKINAAPPADELERQTGQFYTNGCEAIAMLISSDRFEVAI